jgi:hypothetical protein
MKKEIEVWELDLTAKNCDGVKRPTLVKKKLSISYKKIKERVIKKITSSEMQDALDEFFQVDKIMDY